MYPNTNINFYDNAPDTEDYDGCGTGGGITNAGFSNGKGYGNGMGLDGPDTCCPNGKCEGQGRSTGMGYADGKGYGVSVRRTIINPAGYSAVTNGVNSNGIFKYNH